jgi:hypothetical protein
LKSSVDPGGTDNLTRTGMPSPGAGLFISLSPPDEEDDSLTDQVNYQNGYGSQGEDGHLYMGRIMKFDNKYY